MQDRVSGMSYSVGFVLENIKPGGAYIGVMLMPHFLGPPERGWFVAPNRAPARYAFTPRQRGFVFEGSAGWGRGPLRSCEFIKEETAPVLLSSSLVGGFLCESQSPPVAVERQVELKMLSYSILLFSPFRSVDKMDEYERSCYETFKDHTLEADLWYPVELEGRNGEFACGVFKLGGKSADLTSRGTIRYVYCGDWSPLAPTIPLKRWEQVIGHARWLS